MRTDKEKLIDEEVIRRLKGIYDENIEVFMIGLYTARAIHKKTYKQIAEEFGIPYGHIKKMYEKYIRPTEFYVTHLVPNFKKEYL